MSQSKPKVLAFADYYLPGFKGGGPAVSVSRLVKRLAGDFEFAVFTRDRDLGEPSPYANIIPDQWTDRDGVSIFYGSPNSIGIQGLMRTMRTVRPDVVYLNSYFSKLTRTILLLRLLRLVPNAEYLIAPRGEFSKGALGLKSLKKAVFLRVAAATRLHGNLIWQVSSVHELQDTQRAINPSANCFIKAPDLLDIETAPHRSCPPKVPGEARFAFISRIAPIKNLLSSIQMLQSVTGKVEFTIYGPIEDETYWAECEEAIARLPENVRCVYAGPVPPAQVGEKLGQHHFFLFPTLGENYGHVIPEALNAGCPVLLSDQTPWRDLFERDAGWVLPLEPIMSWCELLQKCVDLDSHSYEALSQGARNYVKALSENTEDLDLSRRMFSTVLNYRMEKAA